MTDRRVHERYPARDGAFAVLKNHGSRLGKIIDIRMGGLSLTYVNDNNTEYAAQRLDIFLVDQNFRMERVPIKSMTDIRVETEGPFMRSAVRKGIQFGELNYLHKLQIAYFIISHTVAHS